MMLNALIFVRVVSGYDHEELRSPSGSTISAGHFHTCALRRTPSSFAGIAHCWGFDGFGQVSRAPTETLFVQLSSGHLHACGLSIDEKVYCWGTSSFAPPGLYRQVSAGQFHTCGLAKSGDVKCWGDGESSGCTKPPAGRKFLQLSSGSDWTCGIGAEDFYVECWGSNAKGQSSPPPSVRMVQISSSTSSYHSCGITDTTYDLVCWGENRKGEAEQFREGPFEQVAVGYRTTCAITQGGGKAKCWGLAAHLFHDDFFEEERTSLEQITVGRDHICALEADGTVICSGQPLIDAARVPPGFLAA